VVQVGSIVEAGAEGEEPMNGNGAEVGPGSGFVWMTCGSVAYGAVCQRRGPAFGGE